jgi:hypothetical protein
VISVAMVTVIGTYVVAINRVFLDEDHFLAALWAWRAALQIASPISSSLRRYDGADFSLTGLFLFARNGFEIHEYRAPAFQRCIDCMSVLKFEYDLLRSQYGRVLIEMIVVIVGLAP